MEKPRRRTKHVVTGAKVNKIEKKKAVNIGSVGNKASVIGGLFSKLKGKNKWEREKIIYLKSLFLFWLFF